MKRAFKPSDNPAFVPAAIQWRDITPQDELLSALVNLVALVRNQDIQVTRQGEDVERYLAPAKAAIARATSKA